MRLIPSLVVLFCAGTAGAAPVMVDRVVAALEGGEVSATVRQADVVLASEIDAAARLALAERGAARDDRGPDEQLRRAVLDDILAEVLVFREAQSLGLADVSPDDLERARAGLASRLGGEEALGAFLARTHVSAEELGDLLRRRVVVQRFVQLNVRSSVEVTDEDVERAYSDGNHPFGDRPLAEVQGALRDFLVELRFRGALDRWVRALRERSRVRIIEE